MTFPAPAMIEVNCISCAKPFMARVADRKRGWAKSCSKSCAATHRFWHTVPKGRNNRRPKIVPDRDYGDRFPDNYWLYDDTHPFSEDAMSV